ncbi:MAG TPA: GNAT family N-acetyltransferase [Bacteroidia bacterium]|nr:GNAT family N-acetyltransferase [Bacteroidia bacterium]
MPLVRQVLISGNSLHAHSYDFQKWHWKYFDLKHAKPLIYLCLEGDEIIGYYHCPVYEGIIETKPVLIAMVQDVGITEKARGKGVFAQLAKFANHDLAKNQIDFVITYPNDKSLPTFIKYNQYQLIATLDALILPVKSSLIIAQKLPRFLAEIFGASIDTLFSTTHKTWQPQQIGIVPEFNTEMIQIFELHYNQFQNYIKRSMHYLKWRFEAKPNHTHFIINASFDNKIHTVLVFGIEDLLGVKAAVLLDYATTNPNAMANAMLQLAKNSGKYFNHDVAMFYTSSLPHNSKVLQKCGFIKIPKKLNPRPLNLMAKNITTTNDAYLAGKWQVTLSEWDVL